MKLFAFLPGSLCSHNNRAKSSPKLAKKSCLYSIHYHDWACGQKNDNEEAYFSQKQINLTEFIILIHSSLFFS